MTDPLRIEIEDRGVRAALQRAIVATGDVSPALVEIGEYLTETTKRRFDSSTAPDGTRWAANRLATLALYGNRFSNRRRAAAVSGKKPLIGESRSLSTTVAYQVIGQTLEVGSPMIYAGVQQFGAKARQFGRAPWGDITARPFLGLSADDTATVLDILSDHLLGR